MHLLKVYLCVFLNLNELSRSLKTCNMYMSFRLTDIPMLWCECLFSSHVHCISLFLTELAEQKESWHLWLYRTHCISLQMKCLPVWVENLYIIWFASCRRFGLGFLVHIAWYWSVFVGFSSKVFLRLHAILLFKLTGDISWLLLSPYYDMWTVSKQCISFCTL